MSLDTPALTEARHQVEICNACRYGEGYCAVFPAMFKERSFAQADITQLANFCQNCYYTCQYIEPHEFALNLPGILAEVRRESWERFAWPAAPARLFQRRGAGRGRGHRRGLALLGRRDPAPGIGRGLLCLSQPWGDGGDLHPGLPLAAARGGHGPACLLARGGRNAHHPRGSQGREPQCRAHEEPLGRSGPGLQFRGRRQVHQRPQARASGRDVGVPFVLCFHLLRYDPALRVRSAGTLRVLQPAETAGRAGRHPAQPRCPGTRVAQAQGRPRAGGEMAFVLLLAGTGLTGFALYAATGTGLVSAVLAVHLGVVLAFFLTLPYSKMAHDFYRFAALVRDAQIKAG